MPFDQGQVTDGSINYSLNITSQSNLNIQVMFNSFGVPEEDSDAEFLSLLDHLQGWTGRKPSVRLTAQKFTNVLYQATPTIPDPEPLDGE